jgi:hypothetical protein
MAVDHPFEQDFVARAQVLIEQSRFDRSEAELRRGIAQDPENGLLHGMLGTIESAVEIRYDKNQGSPSERVNSANDRLPFAPQLFHLPR